MKAPKVPGAGPPVAAEAEAGDVAVELDVVDELYVETNRLGNYMKWSLISDTGWRKGCYRRGDC